MAEKVFVLGETMDEIESVQKSNDPVLELEMGEVHPVLQGPHEYKAYPLEKQVGFLAKRVERLTQEIQEIEVKRDEIQILERVSKMADDVSGMRDTLETIVEYMSLILQRKTFDKLMVQQPDGYVPFAHE